MILPAGSSVCTLRNVFKKSFLQSCMPSNIIENSRHPFPDHLLSLYHIYLLLCSIKVLFYLFRFHASHVFLVLYDFILLAIFLEVCIIFHAVRWVNLGIMDMHIRILVSTLKESYHCTCTMCCNTVEAVENVCIYSSLFQSAIAITQALYMMHLQLIA